MADDRILIDATNATFWQLTNYKPGKRLDMSIADDRKMAKIWIDIYREIRGHQDRATQVALRTQAETHAPYILVVERRDGSISPQAIRDRGDLDVQYTWQLSQPEIYTYVAAYDLARRNDAPLYHQFALAVRQQQAATGGVLS